MFYSVSNYFYERRQGLIRTTGYVGAIYLAGTYIKERLEVVKDKVLAERKARDNLRKWFQNNQQNISFTIMALLPTIGQHIVGGMDVEGLTNDLQEKSRAARLSRTSPPSSPDVQAASQQLQDQDSRSDIGSSVVSLIPESTNLGESTRSWVRDFSTASRSASYHEGGRSSPEPSSMSNSAISSENGSSRNGCLSGAPTGTSSVTALARTKAELWKEVKILAFTRTLTTLYSLTLLSLFTHIQLSLLGRSKYIQSVLDQEREERFQEELEQQLSIYALFLDKGVPECETDLLQDVPSIDEETERKYLTLSWWICHIGWKDVGERVRRGVEEVFDEVSLKTTLGAMDLHRLVCDVRRRVEHEVTFEGRERKINFMSTLLPPTPDSMQHVLIQGGIPQSLATSPSPDFTTLLNETRSILSSPDFSIVLEVCLDRATDILFDGLKKNVFVEGGSNVAENGEEIKLILARLLPGLARWSNLALHGLPNELIDGLADLREIEAFSAIIFSRFEDCFK